jgi:predicted alpha/beta superfamily hydrolase
MLENFPVYLTSFKQNKVVRVYLPKNYHQENKRYPVLYMHDGQNVFQDKEAVGGISLGVKDYLDGNELEVIVVGIDSNTGEERTNEYCPWVNGDYSRNLIGDNSTLGGKGKEYAAFIVNELKPFIDNKYRTLKNRNYMAGISLGGLISTYAACRYPNIFTRVAAISPAYFRNQEEIEKLIRNSDLSSIERFYLDCGTNEAGDEKRLSEGFLASNEAVYEILKNKIIDTRLEVLNSAEHHYSDFRKRVPEIFSFLFSEDDFIIG